jgi:hypothetical protein
MKMSTKFQLLIPGMLLATSSASLSQPVITNQPQTQAVAPGEAVTFIVGARGTEPLVYQWQRNLGAGFYDLADCTNAILSLTNTQPWDAAAYRVAVSNVNGVRASAVARLYVMRFAPVSTTLLTDNFDDNRSQNWTPFFNAGTCGIRETNHQFTVYASWAGVRTIYPWDTMMCGIITNSCNLANGQTLEVCVDRVALSENATNATMFEVAQDEQHTYVFRSGRDFIEIGKYSPLAMGLVLFCHENAVTRNTNVTIAVAVSRADPNVILTLRVLDLENAGAVLYQHSVVDTPAADPSVNTAQLQTNAGMSYVTVPDIVGAPYISAAGVLLGLWQYSDGHQPPAEVTYDNFEIRKYPLVLTRYVDANSASPTPPYTNWATAARVIQDAVDAAAPGDEIIVTKGIYTTGGRAVGTNLLVNRVAVDKPLTLRSVNGPQSTVIQGCQVPGTTNGDGAIRCVYLTNGASLTGFTLTNGATRTAWDEADHENSGGGLWCESTNALVANCVLTGNSAASNGGGAYRGTLIDCTITGNSANGGGGGAAWCKLNRCTLTGNSADSGGGAYWGELEHCMLTRNSGGNGGGAGGCTLNNCLLTGNIASCFGGGAFYGNLNNCTVVGNTSGKAGGVASDDFGWIGLTNSLVYYNTALDGPNWRRDAQPWMGMDYCCTAPLPTNGIGNITNAPLFVDYAGGNLRLQSDSPCINAGNNAYIMTTTDLDGNPRLVGATVDIGAYEFQRPASVISYAWLQQYGLPMDGSADFTDSDQDGMNNWQEWMCGTCPTNALSALRMRSAALVGTHVIVTWESVAGVNYFLERSANLVHPFTLLATNIIGQVDTTAYADTTATGTGPFFYRVGR